MHYVGRFEESSLLPPALYAGHSDKYTQATLVDHTRGSVHTGLTVNDLSSGGTISPHVHSFEESFYILSGQAIVSIDKQAYQLGSGDYGTVKVGTLHAWRNASAAPVRWLQMASPQPKADGSDTLFAKNGVVPNQGELLDLSKVQGGLLGHFDIGQIPAPEDRKDVMKGLEGVFLNWMIDASFGARHHRMAFIEYQPGVGIGPHDHTFEESYFFLSGEVEAVVEGKRYDIKAGDVVWTGVGCVHSFANKSNAPVRWLETFSPQPPAENAFRFMAEWEKRARELEAGVGV